MLFFDRTTSIGIDVGCHSIKVAVLSSNKREVANLFEIEIMPDREFIEQCASEESMKIKLEEVLKNFAETNIKFKKDIVTAIPDESSICRYLELPKLEKSKLETAVRSSSLKQIPYSIDEVILNFIPVNPLSAGKDMQGIFFYAIKKTEINKMMELFKKLGITLKSMELSSLALIKEFNLNHGKIPNETIALINIGARSTTIIVLRDGLPYFIRNIAIAGNNFTYAIQMGLQIK